MTLAEFPWMTLAVGLAVALSVIYMLGRLAPGRVVHGVLSACALAGAFAVNEYLHPWNSQSVWVKALGPILVAVAVAEFFRAIRNPNNAGADT